MKRTKKPADKTSGEPCLIVGIGASAGGLNSLECFLRGLPDAFGFAVVFLQHLSPTHKSLLPGLLRSGRPDLEILEITDGLPVLPGKIYLGQPRQDIKIQKGLFHAAPPQKNVRLLIDEFFISLAEEYRDKAVAVIFSGAGTDGARGIQEIRSKGGTVFVQQPDTAEFADMPLSAIHTGQVDKVLSPEEIADEIVKLECASVLPVGEQLIPPEELEALYGVIRDKTGYRLDHYKQSVVSRRIKRRMHLREIPTVGDYIKMISENETEADQLASDLMIGVTSFFRDPVAWKALKLGVIRKLVAEDKNYPVRVWTPACATGEESYSIAMMLCSEFELAGRKRGIQVFATDINDRALEKARDGKYPASISADVPKDLMRQFFTISEDGLSATVSKAIREQVIFAKQNLLTDPPFSRLDLVICRNFLIYLEPSAQDKCLSIFHYALRNDGYLFLGNAESAGRNSGLFKSLNHKKCRLYQKLDAPLSRVPSGLPVMMEKVVTIPPGESQDVQHQRSDDALIQETLIEEYGPTAVAIDKNYDIVYHNGPTSRYLRQPRGAPTQNLLELLPENLRNRIRGAVYRVSREGKPLSIRTGAAETVSDVKERKQNVTFRISKLRDDLFLVVFREKGLSERDDSDVSEAVLVDEAIVQQLEGELSATRKDLQMNIEQLRSLNEELQSSNEEMQAANEELETSREELQSLNEELITVNSQLQSKMEEQEETNDDLNNFLSSTNIPTVFLDHLFRVKRFTPAMSGLVKLIPADVGRPIMDMSRENLGPNLLDDAQDVLNKLVPISREFAVNGTSYIRVTLPYRTKDNRIEGVVITYSDVTEIKKAQGLKSHLAAIVESADDAIISEDLSGIITTWNVGAEKIFGYTAEEGIGRHISFLAPPGHGDEMSDILTRIAQGEHIENYETVRIRKDGVIIPVSLTFSAIRDGNGRIIGASKIAHDISARKKAEEDLVRAKEDWERTFDTVPDLIAILDTQHRVRRVNKAMAERLGLTPEECVGLPCYKAVHGLNAPPSFCPHSRTVSDGREHIEEVHEDALGGDFLVSTTPLIDEQGKVSGSVHVAHDITERKKARDALQKAHDELEVRVQNRTKELRDANELLQREITHRERAEKALRELNETLERRVAERTAELSESEERLKSLYSSMSEGLAVHEIVYEGEKAIDYKIIDVNPAYEKITGLNREIAVGRKASELYGSPEAPYLDIYAGVASTGEPFTFETYFPPMKKHFAISVFSPGRRKFATVFQDITERKRAEQALRESEGRYRELVQNANSAIIRWASDGSITFFNEYAEEFFGWSSDEVIGRHVSLLLPDQESTGADQTALIRDIVDHPERYVNNVNENVCRDGRRVWMTWTNHAIRDERGQVSEILAIGSDISDRKKAEEALRESEQRLARSQEIAHLGSWDMDLIKNQLTWSDEVYRIFGLNPRELDVTYEAFLERVHPEDRSAVDKAYADSVREGRDSYEIEHRIVRKDTEEVRWVRERSQHIRDADGKVICSVGMVHDITERKKAEESIRRQNALLEGINLIYQRSLACSSEEELAQACLAVVEEVTQSRFGFIGEIGADGLLHDIAISNPGWDVCTMYDKSGHRRPPGNFPIKGVYGRVLSDGRGFFTNDPASHPDSIGIPEGHPPLNAFLGVPLIHGERTIGMIGIGNRTGGYRHDELDSLEALAPVVLEVLYRLRAEKGLRRLAEELRRSNEDLQQFARFASHDLQAPLKTVEGFVKLFIRRYQGKIDEQSDNLLGYITESVRDMQTLIKDLLEFSRIEAGSAKLKTVDTSLSLSHALTNLKTAIDENHAKVTVEGKMPLVTGDRTQMIRLFQNLIGNAVKFRRENPPEVRISVKRKEGDWIFSVRDNGIGIDPKHGEQIFDIFRRLHGKSEFPGTGMGLAICKRIVERMGGKIWVESQPGKGSSFYFTIPAREGGQT